MTSQPPEGSAHHVLVLVGTKAQLIKMAPVLRQMDHEGVSCRLVYTGQHSETFDGLERMFGLRRAEDVLVADFEAATHSSFARWTWRFWAQAVRRLRAGAWRDCRIGLVHGDTASTLFAAIVMRIARIPVAHVEAGLRSPRLFDPFPEEIIRRLVSRLAHVHYAPDAVAATRLSKTRGQVVNTGGNTLRDALAFALARMNASAPGSGGYAVASIHRNENLSSRVRFDGLMALVMETAHQCPVKFVLHPATRSRLAASGWEARLRATEGVELVGRMDYLQFVETLLGSCFLMTDGGSNQEEAAMLGLPTLLLRMETERRDGLDAGIVLSRLDASLARQFVAAHAGKSWRLRTIDADSPSERIVRHLQDFVG
jgi:UDP-N-acetylglucosamine 2-epimerase (non-hydrolysing)